MASHAYNLLWISPRFPAPDVASGEAAPPIPDQTIKNILRIAEQNPQAEVRLWVDPKRLTQAQTVYLQNTASSAAHNNLRLMNLRDIPAYNQSFFNAEDTSPDWRLNKHSLIWRQVDAAKILVCLQGDFDQTFYSDADITNLHINSQDIQSRIASHGVMLGGGVDKGFAWYENQMWGFDRTRQGFFQQLFDCTLATVRVRPENGYGVFIDLVNRELKERSGIDTREVCFRAEHDGTVALHSSLSLNYGTAGAATTQLGDGMKKPSSFSLPGRPFGLSFTDFPFKID